MSWDGTERRADAHITDAQIEQIAEMAASKAVAKMTDNAYKIVGKTVIDKFFRVIGIFTCMFITWAAAKGWIKL